MADGSTRIPVASTTVTCKNSACSNTFVSSTYKRPPTARLLSIRADILALKIVIFGFSDGKGRMLCSYGETGGGDGGREIQFSVHICI